MTPSAPATITVGSIASPSSPSVRFTALLEPTITRNAKGTNQMPSGMATSLKNGTISSVSCGSSAVRYSTAAAARPTTAWALNLVAAEIPRELP